MPYAIRPLFSFWFTDCITRHIRKFPAATCSTLSFPKSVATTNTTIYWMMLNVFQVFEYPIILFLKTQACREISSPWWANFMSTSLSFSHCQVIFIEHNIPRRLSILDSVKCQVNSLSSSCKTFRFIWLMHNANSRAQVENKWTVQFFSYITLIHTVCLKDTQNVLDCNNSGSTYAYSLHW